MLTKKNPNESPRGSMWTKNPAWDPRSRNLKTLYLTEEQKFTHLFIYCTVFKTNGIKFLCV